MKNRVYKMLLCAAEIMASVVISFNAGSVQVLAEDTAQTSASDTQNAGQDGNTPPDAPTDGNGTGSNPPAGEMGGGQSQSAVTEWTAADEITDDTTESKKEYSSTGTDENAINISNGATAVLNSPVITRTSTDSTGGDNSSFYGVGAAVLTTDGTTVINGGTIDTDSKGGAGIFSYDSGVTYVSGTTINTTQDTSGGIHVAGGGTLYAFDVTATTQGESSAAIRSDRGGGTMVVDGGTYTSNGTGSPAVYCTADISVNDAELNANNSEGICIEGLNSLRLFDCDLTSNMPDDDQNDSSWSVILYQSMSGDSEVGTSKYDMIGGSLTSSNGGLFYTTNTESEILLDDVDIKGSDDSEYFLRVSGNDNERGWGTSGANGADCNFTAIDQDMDGDVIWDSISNLDMYMEDGSILTGAVEDDETYAGEGGDGYCNMYIDDSSSWVVTGDSTVSALYCEGTITDSDGNTVSITDTDGTEYVDGDSQYTITVETYTTECDLTGALTVPSWSDYDVSANVPEELSIDTTTTSTSDDVTADETSEDTATAVVADTASTDEDANADLLQGEGENEDSATVSPLTIAVMCIAAAIISLLILIIRRKKN